MSLDIKNNLYPDFSDFVAFQGNRYFNESSEFRVFILSENFRDKKRVFHSIHFNFYY